MISILIIGILHGILYQRVLSIPFPCSVYNNLLTISSNSIELNIDYTYGNNIMFTSTGKSIDPNSPSIDALSNFCKCSSFSVSNITIRQQDITSLRIVNQKINASHLSDKPLNCLTGLTSADLSGNTFINGLPDSTFTYQTKLTNLYLDNCQISVISSSFFHSLTNLILLSLRSNRFWSLPSDFLSNLAITSLYLDDNLLLQSIPSALITSNPSMSISLFRTPSLSCIPNLHSQISSSYLSNCSDVLSNDELYLGGPLNCQQVSVRFSSIWDDDDLPTYLSDFVTDISLALSLDSSRIVNPTMITDSGRTTAVFQVLPRLREGQLAPEAVAGRIREQLKMQQQYSMLKEGVVTNWLTAIANIDSTAIILKYCPAMSMFTAYNSCYDISSSATLFDLTSPVFWAILSAGTAIIAIVISFLITCVIQRKKSELQTASTISIMGTATTDSKNSTRQFDMNQGQGRALSAIPFSAVEHPITSYQQARAQSAIPSLQYHTAPKSTAISPKFDDRPDQTEQQQQQQQQRSASVKPRGRKKTKKWDADRLANPWIAKEENQSDDDDDFW